MLTRFLLIDEMADELFALRQPQSIFSGCSAT
jgi:hypothetical protein